jgi:hypothetical protein
MGSTIPSRDVPYLSQRKEDEEPEEQENWFAEDLSEITKDVDFDPGKLWGD